VDKKELKGFRKIGKTRKEKKEELNELWGMIITVVM